MIIIVTYIDDFLVIANKLSDDDSFKNHLPLEAGTKLTTTETWNDDDEVKPSFRELVGAFMYLSVTTRPNLAHSTNVLSQFNNNFGPSHWSAAKRILRDLKGSSKQGIILRSLKDQLIGFADADWSESIDDGHSSRKQMTIYGPGRSSKRNPSFLTFSLRTRC